MKNSIFDSPLIVNQNFFQKLNSLLANQILLIVCIFNKPNVWYFRSLKILAIKTVIPFNFAKILRGRHFALDGPKNFKLLPDVFFWYFFFFPKTVLSSLLLFSFDCYEVDLQSFAKYIWNLLGYTENLDLN